MLLRKAGTACLGLLITLTISGQKFNYPVFEIPDSLKENAHAVVRYYTTDYELDRDYNLKETVKYVVTVLDQGGEKFSDQVYLYDNDRKINHLSVKIYNELGIETESFGKGDFKDYSYDPFGSLFSDSRVLAFSGYNETYPYTIEFNVEIRSNFLFDFFDWYPIDHYNVSTQLAAISVYVPKGYQLNYKENNLIFPRIQEDIGDKTVYSWKIENVKAIEREAFSPDIEKITPHVKLSPSKFRYNEYTGSMEDWQKFGQFNQALNKDRNNLPDEAREEIMEVIKGKNTDLEKAKALYRYMQDNTRYVSIQIGIGGLQPFPASVVHEYAYGDCKALSNYMKSLLEVAGIKSYYARIEAGKYNYDFDTSFTNSPFNHVILYLPIDNKEYWLECTSQISPFGFLGGFTNDRYALVIMEKGGVLKKTTEYPKQDNQILRSVQVNIKPDGMGDAKVRTVYTGLEYDDILGLIHEDYENQKDYLYEDHIEIPDFKINSFRYEDHPSERPSAKEYLDLELINYASASGERLFIPLNLMNRFTYVPPRNKDRRNDIEIYNEFINYDTIAYSFPENYMIEYLPSGDTIEYDFGSLVYTVDAHDNEVVYTRKFEINRATYPNEKYNEFLSFCKKVKKADKQKLILVKKPE